VNTNIKNFVRSHVVKQVIQDFDKDDDEIPSRKEYQGFISMMMEDLEEGEEKDINLDDFFDKYDSNKDGKLDGDEISSILLEVFDYFRTEESIQESPSTGEPVKLDSGEDEIQKLDRLYNEGYLSKERYERNRT